MKIESEKVVTLQYSLSVINDDNTETHVEKTSEENPLVFLAGIGMMIPMFEQNIMGKITNDPFDFVLTPEDAYGLHHADNVAELPMNIFLDEEGKFDSDKFKVGTFVPMMDNQGNQHHGRVNKVGLEAIEMDFNHPMAGKKLHFTGTISDVREATPDELSHGHVHGPGGHHH
ncbi:MAG: FKBP-type peptidyl-prolyl cis-trans isomerase [Bacteroidota bacterium]